MIGRASLRLGSQQVQAICVACIAIILVIGGLKWGQPIIAPVLLGVTLAVVIGPAARAMERLGCPRVVGALFGLVVAVIAIAAVALWAGPILVDLLNALPRLSDAVRDWIADLTIALRGLEDLEGQIAESGEEAVEQAMPSVIDALWLAPNMMAQALITIGTLFFFLLTRDEIYQWAGRGFADRLATADRAVSHYFITIGIVNACLGVAVAVVLSLLGIPDPMIWGAAAFLLNFVLYLGPAIMVLSLLVAGSMQFSGLMILAAPAAYMCLNMIEAQFVTPSFVGQRFALNPLAVFLAIVFGLWLWGPVGGILALPVLVWAVVLSKACMMSEEGSAPSATVKPVKAA